jgi:glycosyltransferase involved in cell wall biosynthesis
MAALLVKQYDDLFFCIAAAEFKSQQKYFQNLKKLVESYQLKRENFMFAGMVENVPAFLKLADIFVFTSVSESGPMAVWEAMSMALPVVTTDVGSVSQYMEDGKSGFIVRPKDPQALSEKVGFLLENPLLGQKMGAEARIVAQQKLDVSIAAEKYASFYRKILGRV